MPRTLPISRSRGRTVESTTSTTRLCFSSTTPVRTVNPKLKMPTRMSTAPMLAKRKRASSASVCGSSASTTAGPGCAASSSPGDRRRPRSGRPACAGRRREAATSCARTRRAPLAKRIVPGSDRSAGTSTTASTASAASAASAPPSSGKVWRSTSRSSCAAVVVSAGRSPGGAGSTMPIGVGSSSPNRIGGTTIEPDDQAVVNSTLKHEAAAPAALDDLAPGDEPDAAPAAHATASSAGVAAGVRLP